ncbi:hypothetical protein GQ457_06G025150 [Hibiscus cannabinus]
MQDMLIARGVGVLMACVCCVEVRMDPGIICSVLRASGMQFCSCVISQEVLEHLKGKSLLVLIQDVIRTRLADKLVVRDNVNIEELCSNWDIDVLGFCIDLLLYKLYSVACFLLFGNKIELSQKNSQ